MNDVVVGPFDRSEVADQTRGAYWHQGTRVRVVLSRRWVEHDGRLWSYWLAVPAPELSGPGEQNFAHRGLDSREDAVSLIRGFVYGSERVFTLVDYAAEPGRTAPSIQQEVPLSRRELEVARLVAEGLTNKEIASRLFIAERTAGGHVDQICNKLGFNSRVQIAALYPPTEVVSKVSHGNLEQAIDFLLADRG